MSRPSPLRIIGVGSPHGDDAVGWAVVRRLRADFGTSPEIEWHLLEGGQQLLDVMDGRGTLWLVDAVSSGRPAGTIECFTWPDPRVDILRAGSTHDLRPTEALRLAAVLGLLPPQVMLFGIEIGRLDPDGGLCPEVAAALPQLVQQLALELTCEHSLTQAEAQVPCTKCPSCAG